MSAWCCECGRSPTSFKDSMEALVNDWTWTEDGWWCLECDTVVGCREY